MQGLLLECAVRAALIAGATAAVLAALRVKNAAARHAAWLGVVVWMLTLPAWTAWAPKAPLRLLPPAARSAVIRTLPVPATALAETPLLPLSAPAPQRTPWNWLLVAYLTGVGLLLSRLAMGAVRAQALIRTAVKQDGQWTSVLCAAPVTVGWLRPRVILPAGWSAWPPQQLAAVLAHENEHARRRDPLKQALALANRALFWFHPVAWWLERHLSSLAEEACDAAVLIRGHNPFDYSTYLLNMARAVELSGTRIDVLGMAMPGSSLPRRIRQILSAHPVPPMTRARMLTAAAACLLVSAVCAEGTLARVRTATPAILPLVSAVQPAPIPAPAAPLPAPQPQATPAPGRLLVLYFNPAAMDSADLDRARPAAEKFVAAQLRTTDRVSVMVFRNAAIQILQDFTEDREQLVQAIGRVPGAEGGSPDPNRQVDGLRAAVRLLEPLEGKKAVVYFSTGGPVADSSVRQSLIDAAIRANVAFYLVDIRGAAGKAEAPQEFAAAPRPTSGKPYTTFQVGTTEVFARVLSNLYPAEPPIIDKTGLQGIYQFAITTEPSQDLVDAVQEQLGLKLTPVKAPAEILVIDHAERIPIDN